MSASSLHWFHWVIIAMSFLLTFFAWYYSRSQFETRISAQFDRDADQVVELVIERMQKYEDALWSGVALIDTSGGDIDFEHWTNYASNIRIEKKYPGINGIGVVHATSKAELSAYVAEQQKLRPDYHVHPAHAGDEYFPIAYITPVKGNEQAVGLDMAHETNRYTAAKKSRDTGKTQITGPITLVQDGGKTPGFLFYAPFYHGGTHDTVADRRLNFTGMVYAPFVVRKLMEGVLEKEKRHVGIRLADANDTLYDELIASETDFDSKPLFKRSIDVELYGRTWKFEVWSSNSFRHASIDNQPLTILFGGIFINSLLIILFVSISRSSQKALRYADSMTRELEIVAGELEQNQAFLEERAKQLAQAGRYKSEFLANMSHELRTPLNSLLILAQYLKENKTGNLTDHQVDSACVIYSGGKDLLGIINDILDLSKVEAGKLDVHYENLQLSSITRSLASQFAPLAQEKNLEFKTTIAEGVSPQICTDSKRVGQILKNLLSNAFKFTVQGGVNFNIDRPDADTLFKNTELTPQNSIAFSVSDTGCGIPGDKQQVIFEAFRQADGSTNRQFGGTGLGLTISREMSKLLGGEIHVQSRENKGSTFTLFLPIVNAESYAVANIPAKEVEPLAPVEYVVEGESSDLELRGRKILLVDDDVRNIFALSSALEDAGLVVMLADNGQFALELLDSNSDIELVVMDIMMPVMDGHEAMRAIREQPRFEELPIIAFTAKAMPEDRLKCISSGASEYVTKPVDAQELLSLIRVWLDSHETVAN